MPLIVHCLDEVADHIDRPIQQIDIVWTLLPVINGDTSQLWGREVQIDYREVIVSH